MSSGALPLAPPLPSWARVPTSVEGDEDCEGGRESYGAEKKLSNTYRIVKPKPGGIGDRSWIDLWSMWRSFSRGFWKKVGAEKIDFAWMEGSIDGKNFGGKLERKIGFVSCLDGMREAGSVS